MTFTRADYARILHEYDFARFPRNVGPYQRLVINIDQLLQHINMSNGDTAVYTSHNSWAEVDKWGRPTKVMVTKTFMDLDIDKGTTLEMAKRDADTLIDWCLEQDLSCAITFSGHGGFQFFLFFKPSIHEIGSEVTRKIRAVQAFLIQQLDLKTCNLACAEPRRLCRIPLTYYATDKYDFPVVTHQRCTPIPPLLLREMTMDEVWDLSMNPTIHPTYRFIGQNQYNIDEFLQLYSVPIEPDEGEVPLIVQTIPYTAESKDEFAQLVKLFMPDPCVHNDLLTNPNPKHISRLAFCAMLRLIGFSEQEAKNFFTDLEERFSWIDRANRKRREYYIHHIFHRNPPYSPAGCPRYMAEGICVGEVCPKWKFYAMREVKARTLKSATDVEHS